MPPPPLIKIQPCSSLACPFRPHKILRIVAKDILLPLKVLALIHKQCYNILYEKESVGG